jgi:hypothetical protein
MAVSNNQLAALVATIVPLVASIFAQQSERQERSKARAAEEKTRLEAKRNADGAVDNTSASQLNEVLKRLANDPAKSSVNGELCSTLHTSLELMRQSDPTPKTEAVLAAWLTYRPEKADGRLVCQCKRTIGVAHEAWDELRVSGSRGRPVPKELLFALNAADDECNPDVVASAKPPMGLPATGDDLPTLSIRSPARGARVYMQVPDDHAKDALTPVQEALRNAGYRVHEIEVVGKRAPRCAELRYVYANDTPEATTLLDDLNKERVQSLIYQGAPASAVERKFTPKRMGRYEGRSLNRVYELWLPVKNGEECT